MKKTITSNIAGTVFHIDEDAFRALETYLSDIRSFYAGQEGEDDIVSGIEERIGEIFRDKVKGGQPIITMADVEAVITVMGRPEAFEGDDDPQPKSGPAVSGKSSGKHKRLFRDPDNRVLGGVCSGVSHYLGINDPIWFRLAFLLSFIFAGSGLLLYIILWIVIPSAKSYSEKLEMRGEHVNVDNISRKVNEELEGLRKKWDETSVGRNGTVRQISDFVMRAVSLILQFVMALVRFLGGFLGLLLLLIGAFTFMVLAAVSLGLGTVIQMGSEGVVNSDTFSTLLENMAGGEWQAALASIAFLLLVGIPFLALAFLGARLLFNIRKGNRAVAIALAGLWALGWVFAPIAAAVIGRDYTAEGERTETIALEMPAAGTEERPVTIALNSSPYDDDDTEVGEVFGMQLLFVDGKTSIYGLPQFNIVKSESEVMELVMTRSARGGSKRDASERANAIDYGFAQNDTALLLNGHFAIPDADKWRNQEVELELRLPVGTTVLLTEEMERIIHDIQNTTDTYDGDMVGRRWKMTEQGLECVDCDGLISKKKGRRKAVVKDLDEEMDELEEELTRDMEELKRELNEEKEELRRKKEELRKKKETTASSNSEGSGTDMGEILLKRVVTATWQVDPSTIRSITMTAFPH